ncbi:protein SHQ1 homolog [Arctopsyche grandis]|uniref:protein SHQ1 homolog n=1 Tax=Arctopsyche grandis TaxID=121162 RepID=UPI00406DA473
MLVPKFKLDQTDQTVTVKIHSPYSNIEDAEVYVEKNEFIFSSTPYHLRLNLPGDIVENDVSVGKYDCDSGYYTFTFDKVNEGEFFKDLDMVTSLLAPKEMTDVTRDLIEIINSGPEESGIVESVEPSRLPNADISFTNHQFAYGFANKTSGSFRNLSGEFPNIFELKTPEEISFGDRKKLMQEYENTKFSSDHYLADYFDEELISPILAYKASWEDIDSSNEIKFTDDELEILKDLPNKEYLLTKEEFDNVTYSLVDIIYAYCFEKRVTCNENTIESSWTINRISGTLSWFAVFSSITETLISCYRRSLIYPIYRNFKLSTKVCNDVETIFKLGRKYIVKCLIEIYQLFNLSQDARYILNQLYMKDFLIFSQKCSEDAYKTIYEDISTMTISKSSLNLDLEEYEDAGKMVQVEEAQILENTIALKVASMKLVDDISKSEINKNTGSEADSDDYSNSSSVSTSSSSSSTSSELDSDDESD